jgi:hypothetical protein
LAFADRVERTLTLNASEVCRAVNARIVTVSIMIVVKLFDAIEVAFLLVVGYKSISSIVRYYTSLEGIELCAMKALVGISYLDFTKVTEETVNLTLR